jgi:hypothetical protein
MSFMDNYEPVADRIAKFWDKYPNGRLHTEIVLINETEIVIKASAFTDREDTRPTAIDFAQETRGSSNINKQSFVENCATSAIGRCLATLNFQPKRDGKAVRPSREEMQKTVAKEAPPIDFLSAAQFAFQLEQIESLQEIYKDAKRAKAAAEVLQQIAALGTQLKEKGTSPQN